MPCTSPLQGYFLSPTQEYPNGKFLTSNLLNREFYGYPVSRQDFEDDEKRIGANTVEFQMGAPCRKCLSCRLDKSREWSIRGSHELKMHNNVGAFLTLTYNNESLAHHCMTLRSDSRSDCYTPGGSESESCFVPTLVREHIVRFNKTLRQHLFRKFGKKVKILYCGEYGSRFRRPHWHLIVFGEDFSFDRKVLKRTSNNDLLFTSDLLDEIWPYGFHFIGTVTPNSIGYVARYTLDKLDSSPNSHVYDDIASEIWQPGLGFGKSWIAKYWQDVYPGDRVVWTWGNKVMQTSPPAYYDRWMKEHQPEVFNEVLRKRKIFVSEKEALTLQELDAKDLILQDRTRSLIREMHKECA